jgi:flagellin-specific chaperone FliS
MTITPTNRKDFSSGHLLDLTCDAVQRDLAAAEADLAGGHTRAAASSVCKARRILLELIAALDPQIAPDVTDALRGLYQHLFDRLSDPAAAADPDILRAARRTLRDIRDAWGS